MNIKFVREKETDNTIRFKEEPPLGKPRVAGTFYVQKWALEAEFGSDVQVLHLEVKAG